MVKSIFNLTFLFLTLVTSVTSFSSLVIPNSFRAQTRLNLRQDSISDIVRLVDSLDYDCDVTNQSRGVCTPKTTQSTEKLNKLKRHAIDNIGSLQARVSAERSMQSAAGNRGILKDMWERLTSMRVRFSEEEEDDVDITDDVV